MKQYSLAFIFSQDLRKVLLVRKKSPEWQRGKLNGVGGKFEEGENQLQCVVREVREETGVVLPVQSYTFVGSMGNAEWTVYIYGVQLDTVYDFSLGSEDVEWCAVGALPDSVIRNLTWLVPYTMDALIDSSLQRLEVRYL